MERGDSLYSEWLSDLNIVIVSGQGPAFPKIQYIAIHTRLQPL